MACVRRGLVAPSTMGIEDRSKWTWTATMGQRHRIDYILLPEDMLQEVISTESMHMVDTMNKLEDHVPTRLVCRASFMRGDSAGIHQSARRQDGA